MLCACLGLAGPSCPPASAPRQVAAVRSMGGPAPVLTGLALLQEEEEQEEEDDDEDDDDTDDLDELDTDQLLEAELEEDENNENAGEDGDNDFSPSDEELANLLDEGEDGEDEDSEADEEVELILGDSECGGAAHRPARARGGPGRYVGHAAAVPGCPRGRGGCRAQAPSSSPAPRPRQGRGRALTLMARGAARTSGSWQPYAEVTRGLAQAQEHGFPTVPGHTSSSGFLP